MTSYRDQISATVGAHSAVNSLESQARSRVAALIQQYEAGQITGQQIRYRLENLVRQAYRASGEIGSNLVAAQSGLEDWQPQERVFSSAYLNALLMDVRRNLQDYKASERDALAQRRLQLRIQASIGVGTQRGYTDAQLKGYKELKDFGFQLRKVWWANFVNNTPCPMCAALHGKDVELEEDFGQGLGTKVYHNLEGPPRHPNCQCTLVVLISTLENAYEGMNFDAPQKVVTDMSTDQVRKMPLAFFLAVVKTLKKIISKFGHKS
jgi:hypothetical protein